MPVSPRLLPIPEPVTSVIALEPVYNILMSMSLLGRTEHTSGLDEWVSQATLQLDQRVLERHELLFRWIWLDALTNAVPRGVATEDFSAYLDALATQDAVVLRDTLFRWTIHSPHERVSFDSSPIPSIDPATLLADYDAFVHFLEEFFKEVNDTIPRTIHDLFNEPDRLQSTLVTHLEQIWNAVVAEEWQRVHPRLQATVEAFQQVSLQGLTMLEAMQVVTDRDLRFAFRMDTLLQYRQVRFIPHLHSGPYIIWFGDNEELRIGFPARKPTTHMYTDRRFDQTTLANRYKALADETRLGILWALRDVGELSTQDVIDRFRLDKSAASRHLRQLVATSLIEERREAGATKVYQLNPQAIDEIVHMLDALR